MKSILNSSIALVFVTFIASIDDRAEFQEFFSSRQREHIHISLGTMSHRARFLASLFLLCFLAQYVNCDDHTQSFEVGDLGQYSTTGVGDFPKPSINYKVSKVES